MTPVLGCKPESPEKQSSCSSPEFLDQRFILLFILPEKEKCIRLQQISAASIVNLWLDSLVTGLLGY